MYTVSGDVRFQGEPQQLYAESMGGEVSIDGSSSSIKAKNVTLGLCGRGPGICQETCELIINGETHEAVPIDVKEMYRQKILGK